MNIGNILKVADAIEQASVPGLGFNLRMPHGSAREGYPDLSGHNCGTVACIAGWACEVEGRPVSLDWGLSLKPWACQYFDLTRDEADNLMSPVAVIFGDLAPSDKDAVRALRNFAITGKVDWEAAMKGDEPLLPPLPVSKALVRTTA